MADPTKALVRSELRLFGREPASLFWILGFPTLLIVLIGLVPAFRDPSEDLGGLRVIDLYVPIAVLLAILFAAVQAIPTVLATYREQQILRRLATTPARPRDVLVAQCLVHALAIVVGSVVAVVVARLVYGVELPAAPIAFVVVLALTLASCLALGALIGGTTPNARTASAVATVLFFPLMFTAGVWLPVQAMPDRMADVVERTPLGAAALALGEAQVGDWPAWSLLVTIALWTVVFGFLASRWFKWS